MGRRETIRLRQRELSPEQLSAFLLQKIKRDAEAFLGESVERAVVTVPAYFDDNQRSATKDACRIAGIEVARLVNEPTAAALAYGLDRLGQELRIAMIDCGGGTLDVTIMEFGQGVFEVKVTSGDTQLGGTDMNRSVFDYLADRFRADSGVDVGGDRMAAACLLEAAEMAKIELSTSTTTRISLPFFATVNGQPRHFERELTRTELERLVRPVIDSCRGPVEQALHDAGITPRDIDRVIFVDGPTRMPAVRSFFGLVSTSISVAVDCSTVSFTAAGDPAVRPRGQTSKSLSTYHSSGLPPVARRPYTWHIRKPVRTVMVRGRSRGPHHDLARPVRVLANR